MMIMMMIIMIMIILIGAKFRSHTRAANQLLGTSGGSIKLGTH